MDKELLLDLFTREQRINVVYSDFQREELEYIVRHVSQTQEQGFVLHSKLTEKNADDEIVKQIEYFSKIGQKFEWKLYDYDQPHNLKTRLEAHGFEIGEAEALMVMDVTDNHPILSASIPEEVRQITSDEGINDVMALEDEVWGTSHTELGERLKRDLATDPEHLRIFAAYDGDKVVSAAWMYLHEGTSFGSLWGGSTLLKSRQKGFYQALIAARAKVAIECGYRFLMVDASPMSRPILEKRGFQCLTYSYPCVSP